MTPDIEHRLRLGVQDYLAGDKQNPTTVRSLFGCGWSTLPGRTRSTVGAWFLKKVRKGGFPGLCIAGTNDENHMTYTRC